VKAVALTRAPENEGENQDISLEATFTLSMAGCLDMFFFRCFCLQSLVSAYCSGECYFLPSHSLTCEIFFLSKYTLQLYNFLFSALCHVPSSDPLARHNRIVP